MRLYLAGIASSKKMSEWVVENYPEIGALCSFFQPKTLDKCLEFGFKYIMLDSGAFSVENSGGVVDIDEYAHFIKTKVHPVTNVEIIPVGLDVISDVTGELSRQNWEYLLNKGIWTLPTYHIGESLEILEYYVQNSEYVGLGGMAGKNVDWKYLVPAMQQIFYKYPHKYHIFGINDPRIVKSQPFFSCDALTWRSGSRFGQVITPWGRWWINARNSKSSSYDELEKAGIIDWLEEKGIPFPLPEDYDFTLLDKLNIQTLYEEIVKFHEEGIFEERSLTLNIW